jgi:hypothetical protein
VLGSLYGWFEEADYRTAPHHTMCFYYASFVGSEVLVNFVLDSINHPSTTKHRPGKASNTGHGAMVGTSLDSNVSFISVCFEICCRNKCPC